MHAHRIILRGQRLNQRLYGRRLKSEGSGLVSRISFDYQAKAMRLLS